MRGLKLFFSTAFLALGAIAVVYAGSSASIGGVAHVPRGSPSINLIVKELTQANQEPWSGATVQEMNFGELTYKLTDGSDAGVWFSPKYYCVFIITTSYGHHYEIKSSCTGISSGTDALPAESLGVTPAYRPEDEWKWDGGSAPQGAMPEGSTLGSAGPAIVADKSLYKSESNRSSNRIIRAFYSLPCYGAEGALPFAGYKPIPKAQAAGTYTGTVLISIVVL
jgi:hypothetical protein